MSYETAYYAVSDAYFGTLERIEKCNLKTGAALLQIEEAERIINDNAKTTGQ